jgi:predicted glycosyltransferase involved in capsule biosynthesis
MSDKLLSIIIPGKNDTYHNATKRLVLNLDKTIANINKHDYSVEMVLCDWGSEEKIFDAFGFKPSDKIKCVYVPPDIAQKYNRDVKYSIVHPLNTAFRHTTGKYVIFWDSDCYVTEENFCKLYEFVERMDADNRSEFLWGSRYHIPYDVHNNAPYCEYIDNYLQTLDLSTIAHDKISLTHFMGCSISLLMPRSFWEESTGWWEELIYWGWQDIEFHYRLCHKYKFGGDLEDSGINFFHLDHHNLTVNSSRRENPQRNSPVFKANPDNWGLRDENLIML